MKRAFAGALMTLLSACAPVTGGDMAKGDPGPFPDDYQQIVMHYLAVTLKDPYSVRDFAIQRPVQTPVWQGVFRGGDVQAWKSCVSYNAKNSFGAYTGIKYYTFYFRAGQIMNDAAGSLVVEDGC